MENSPKKRKEPEKESGAEMPASSAHLQRVAPAAASTPLPDATLQSLSLFPTLPTPSSAPAFSLDLNQPPFQQSSMSSPLPDATLQSLSLFPTLPAPSSAPAFSLDLNQPPFQQSPTSAFSKWTPPSQPSIPRQRFFGSAFPAKIILLLASKSAATNRPPPSQQPQDATNDSKRLQEEMQESDQSRLQLQQSQIINMEEGRSSRDVRAEELSATRDVRVDEPSRGSREGNRIRTDATGGSTRDVRVEEPSRGRRERNRSRTDVAGVSTRDVRVDEPSRGRREGNRSPTDAAGGSARDVRVDEPSSRGSNAWSRSPTDAAISLRPRSKNGRRPSSRNQPSHAMNAGDPTYAAARRVFHGGGRPFWPFLVSSPDLETLVAEMPVWGATRRRC
uniref:Uncharacterized protein n=1 Tax=Kalanchoe fedtschenkoi TaxID=63787 RepID=A0A7N1A3A6_KALFE